VVELSPNEETALQRIAQGMMLTADMEPHHPRPTARLLGLSLGCNEADHPRRADPAGRDRWAPAQVSRLLARSLETR
jgi:hypothetical protein